jgi:putative PIN family toxin of toxin-antitoxin system
VPRARRPSAVLDTNVVVSGVFTRTGPPFEILHLWHARRFTLILTERVNREYHRILSDAQKRRSHKLLGFDPTLFLHLLSVDAVWIDREIEPIIRSRDPNDDPLLSAALNGEADFLVTGDIDLLELASDPRLGSIRIITPRAFVDELRAQGE